MASVRFLTLNLLEDPAVVLLNGAAATLGVVCQWTNGSAIVTRASGSFISDGVKLRSLVSGNLATKFPANVRVSTLSDLSMTLTSAATAVGSGTESGTFTPNAALSEASGYPASNVMNGRRYSEWKTAATPPATVALEFDLGAAFDVSVACVLAHSDGSIASAFGASSGSLKYATTYTGAAPTWNTLSTLAINGTRDAALVFGSTISARYWRFEFTPRSVSGVRQHFGVGGLWLGAVDVDLGSYGNPDSSRRAEKNRARLESGGRQPYFIRTGFDVYRFALQFPTIEDATFALLESAFNGDRPPIMLDHTDRPFEVEFADDALDWRAVFTGLSGSSPSLVSLP